MGPENFKFIWISSRIEFYLSVPFLCDSQVTSRDLSDLLVQTVEINSQLLNPLVIFVN